MGALVAGALVVAMVVLPPLQIPKKAQGSMRSFGTPPKAKVKLAKRTSTIFMILSQNEVKYWIFFGVLYCLELWILRRLAKQMSVQFLEIQGAFNNLKIHKCRLMRFYIICISCLAANKYHFSMSFTDVCCLLLILLSTKYFYGKMFSLSEYSTFL